MITPERAAEAIREVTDEIRDLLLKKNASYGNSVFDPLRVFSKAALIEQINVRIDDKLSRIARGDHIGEDTVLDLIGYLVIRRIAEKEPK